MGPYPRLCRIPACFLRTIVPSILLAMTAPSLGIAADPPAANSTGGRALTFDDMMHFRDIRGETISGDGRWIAFEVAPGRGDGEVQIVSTKGDQRFTLPLGSRPSITRDGRFAVAVRNASQLVEEKKKAPAGLWLIDLESGETVEYDRVRSHALSRDSQWLAILHGDEPEVSDDEPQWAPARHRVDTVASDAEAEDDHGEPGGRRLVLRHLETGRESVIDHVLAMQFDPTSRALVLERGLDAKSEREALGWIDLAAHDDGRAAAFVEFPRESGERYAGIVFVKDRARAALVATRLPEPAPEAEDEEDGNENQKENGEAEADADAEAESDDDAAVTEVRMWDVGGGDPWVVVSADAVPDGGEIPENSRLSWSLDGERLFFGWRSRDDAEEDESGGDASDNEEGAPSEQERELFDVETILDKRELDVWHWLDPRIVPNQKKMWDRVKDRTLTAVVHVSDERVVRLADAELPDVNPVENARYAIGRSQLSYEREVTWDGSYYDLSIVDLRDGSRRSFAKRSPGQMSLAPGGRYVVLFDHPHWLLVDCESGASRVLTNAVDVSFADVDHDYPSTPRGYGVAGWEADDAAVYLYDKYDIWRFATDADGAAPVRLTAGEGRARTLQFRVRRLDRDERFFEPGQEVLLSGYHDRLKWRGVFAATIGSVGVEPRLVGDARVDLVAKAEDTDRLMYTRQTYNDYPDLWVTDAAFRSTRRLTDVNPQVAEYAWGNARLVEWRSLDNKPLQGVLITPPGHRAGDPLPVLVYFYRFFSQRLYDFNPIVINHRPCFPLYVSNGYAVFLPDVRFEIGRPGLAAVKCVVPGVQKLIADGIADPDAIGLHGHSWSGYQAAFIITQTDLFAATVAGAPVSNMTSAYSGIRLGTGLARQFQYEKSQSRIGGTLWNALDDYIANSPVFYADRINSPLLIQFGDIDEAVPWQQGIELYLAMRRLDKECVFLQYRGEPHHLRKYANKLDYSIKMKEYFDHYLRGADAPEWMTEGVPYRGE